MVSTSNYHEPLGTKQITSNVMNLGILVRATPKNSAHVEAHIEREVDRQHELQAKPNIMTNSEQLSCRL